MGTVNKNAWEYFPKIWKKKQKTKQPFWFQFSEKYPNDENTSLYSVLLYLHPDGRKIGPQAPLNNFMRG